MEIAFEHLAEDCGNNSTATTEPIGLEGGERPESLDEDDLASTGECDRAVEMMTGDEAKTALSVSHNAFIRLKRSSPFRQILLTALNLAPNSLRELQSRPEARETRPPAAKPLSISAINRAVRLVSDIDELVWRRSRYTNARRPDDVYGEENAEAVLDRLRVWESAVRTRGIIRKTDGPR